MSGRIAFAALVLAVLPAGAVAQPASIENARVEVATDVTPRQALDRIGRGAEAEWVGWSISATAEAGNLCCFGNDFRRRGCSLAARESSWGTSDRDVPGPATELIVLVEVRDGSASRVRVVSPSCPVEGADRRLLWLGAAEPSQSLALLGRLIEVGADDVAEPALAAAAYHADPRADALIERRALDRTVDRGARQQALFWAGNTRGAAGYAVLERVLDTEPDPELRQHAVFALTQSPVPRAIDRIKRAAIEDADGSVRGQALFWLAQSGAAGAGEWILGRLDAERDDEVREQAVFALSQLDDGTDRLLSILHSKRDLEIIRRALFWLAQSGDPRALQEIEKILDR